MARAPLLQLSNIGLGFGGDPLFEGLDLVVQPGDRLALVGVATGMLLGTITAVAARHPHWLTPDTALYGSMASFTPYMMASLVMAGICIFLDGVLQAVGDLQYLCKSQAINVLALWLCLYGYVKQSGVGIIGVSLPPARLPPSSSSSHPLHLSPSHPRTPTHPRPHAPSLFAPPCLRQRLEHSHIHVPTRIIYMCMYICAYMYIHIRTRIHAYTKRTHARTHTHTHTQVWYGVVLFFFLRVAANS